MATTSTTTVNGVNIHTIVLWFIGALILVGLADFAPTVAIWIAVILVMLVLLKNWSQYAQYLGIKA